MNILEDIEIGKTQIDSLLEINQFRLLTIYSVFVVDRKCNYDKLRETAVSRVLQRS